jgi:hypothetical protein
MLQARRVANRNIRRHHHGRADQPLLGVNARRPARRGCGNLMSLGQQAANQGPVARDVPANQKEGCPSPVAGKDVEDRRGSPYSSEYRRSAQRGAQPRKTPMASVRTARRSSQDRTSVLALSSPRARPISTMVVGLRYSLRICLIRAIASSTACSGLMPSATTRWTASGQGSPPTSDHGSDLAYRQSPDAAT